MGKVTDELAHELQREWIRRCEATNAAEESEQAAFERLTEYLARAGLEGSPYDPRDVT